MGFRTVTERNQFIVDKKKEGASNQEIAQKTKLSIRQIQNISKAYKKNGRIVRKKGSGRKDAMSPLDKARVRMKLRINPFRSCRSLV